MCIAYSLSIGGKLYTASESGSKTTGLKVPMRNSLILFSLYCCLVKIKMGFVMLGFDVTGLVI